MKLNWPVGKQRESDIVWIDLGDLGDLVYPQGPPRTVAGPRSGAVAHHNAPERSQDRRRLHAGRHFLEQLAPKLRGYKMALMNVRSYTFPVALKGPRKSSRRSIRTAWFWPAVCTRPLRRMRWPRLRPLTGSAREPAKGLSSTWCGTLTVSQGSSWGRGSRSMAEWPQIDRELWPKPANWKEALSNARPRRALRALNLERNFNWPMEPECGWGPPPVATIITSRVCPWQCVFCNEASYIPNMGRRPVSMIIDELNALDEKYGVGSVVIHDSMFFQNPKWLQEWIEEYPRRANKVWPYWAAGRADTVRQWPELFTALVRETNWNLISIGFESGSDRILKLLNKECTEEDNNFAIDLVNRLGDEMVAEGKEPPVFWSNIMLGIPGETDEDAFKTMRMLKRMKRVFPSISYYAPYPGSALGFQLIAEGKSLMSKDNYHRFPDDEKVKGVNYGFYRELLAGKFDAEVNRGLTEEQRQRGYDGMYQQALVKA